MGKNNLCPQWAETENLRWAFWGWDPLPYYRRLGHKSVPFFGNSLWCKKWRKRLHSEETIKQMAELGINVAITQFFKGFGLQHEKELIEELKELIRIFHKYNMKVLGYTQFRSIFYETFLYEEPDAKNWIQRKYDGTLRCWAGSYLRWAPCINSKEFTGYLKKVVDIGAKEVGLDGFHFDNSYAEPCYCPRCRDMFREYLEKNIKDTERLGFNRFDFVELPPELSAPVYDPLYQEWIKFRVKNSAEVFNDIYMHIKGISKDLCFHSNPAFPRENANKRGVHPYLYGKSHDLICAENTNFPRYENGTVVHQIRAYKFGESCGYKTLPASWLFKNNDYTCPEKESQVKLSIIEPAVFGGCIGSNWALRTTKGDSVVIDNKVLAGALKKYISFLDRNKDLYRKVKTDSRTALLYSFESFAYRDTDVLESYNAFESTLIDGNIAYDILMAEEIEQLDKYDLLIIANQFCLSDCIVDKITDFVRNGGKLLLTEESGRFDENHLEREVNPLRQLEKPGSIHVIPESLNYKSINSDKSSTRWIITTGGPRPENHETVLNMIKELIGHENIDFEAIDAPDCIIMNQRKSEDGRTILHIINYNNEEKVENLKIRLSSEKFFGAKCRIYDPEQENFQEFVITDNNILLSEIYTCKVLEFIC